jgi:hypothetical protein
MMNVWLQSLSTRKINGVDVGGVADVDEWMDRLRDADHFVFASSGTSGKASFVNQTQVDRDRTFTGTLNQVVWQVPSLKPDRERPCFASVPRFGPHRFTDITIGLAEALGTPEGTRCLSDIPTRAADINRMGLMRTRIAEGKATPDETAAFEREVAQRAARMEESLNVYYDAILENRTRPFFMVGMWQQLYAIAERARARGIDGGDFHPGATIMFGGGLKGAVVPPNFQEIVLKFLGKSRSEVAQTYGMVELQVPMPYSTRAGGYVVSPWVIPLILDRSGEQLLNPKSGRGTVEGRMAFLDLSIEGRWGGIISGDKVTVSFDRHTLQGPIVTSVARYRDLPEGDDKLSCAGTIDSYVRGEINV